MIGFFCRILSAGRSSIRMKHAANNLYVAKTASTLSDSIYIFRTD
jgi:hypothetical protein